MTEPHRTGGQVRLPPVLTPRLRYTLAVLLAAFVLLLVNGTYLLLVRIWEWWAGASHQNFFYQYMFLFHLGCGLAMLLPLVHFCWSHWRRARHHPHRRAARLGYGLLSATLALACSGILLMRIPGLLEFRQPWVRSLTYLVHVIAPWIAIGLYVAHRRVVKPSGRVGVSRHASRAALVAAAVACLMLLHQFDPRVFRTPVPGANEGDFSPSLARTASGGLIPARHLMNDDYCLACHADIHHSWQHSAHHLSSFNNPAYLASVRETRQVMLRRDGNVGASRWCAGCHDPAPLFSGQFDDPKWDDLDYNLAGDPVAQAGITCTACHAVTQINSPRGNADYTLEDPLHYPFAFSRNRILQWVNHTLIRANPAFHKRTFLKPLHKTPEFCGSCHKVHLPFELNAYRFLRGQNHYDSFLLSGVSGHGAASFYYPERAETNCNGCHMPLRRSDDLGARHFDASGQLKVHDHQFPSANTALAAFGNWPAWVNQRHGEFNHGVMRVDLFGIKPGGRITDPLVAPLRPDLPQLQPGQSYLLEAVIRTLKLGHHFTQGTADSNEVWLDVTVTQGGRTIGRSGGMNRERRVDPWSHFVNAFVIDVSGRRIDRRNAQDIFVALYDHQIPPGAGQVVHYHLVAPADSTDPITVELKLQYRKFDTDYVHYFRGDAAPNDLPVMTLAVDRVTFAVAGGPPVEPTAEVEFPTWQRWNDYGIGLLLEGNQGSQRGELRQAEEAFYAVERLGYVDGPLNRARVYLKEGRLDDARQALARSAQFDPPPNPWTQLWLTGLTNQQTGALDQACDNFRQLLQLDTTETQRRGFDFRRDYRIWNELGKTIFERSKQERGTARRGARDQWLKQAAEAFQQTLAEDPENVAAHYNLAVIYELLGQQPAAQQHSRLHAAYKPDDNARERAIIAARAKYPAANHAANAIVIWDLHRPEAYGLEREEQQ